MHEMDGCRTHVSNMNQGLANVITTTRRFRLPTRAEKAIPRFGYAHLTIGFLTPTQIGTAGNGPFQPCIGVRFPPRAAVLSKFRQKPDQEQLRRHSSHTARLNPTGLRPRLFGTSGAMSSVVAFGGRTMVLTRASFTVAVMVAAAARANAAELQRATADAWREYVQAVDARMQARLESGQPFLWVDEEVDRPQRTRRGETLVAPLVGRGTKAVPNGLIHHWIGAIFIPDAGIPTVLDVVHGYNRYEDIYKPVVTRSRLLDSGPTGQEFSMDWHRRVLFLDAAIRGRYHAHDVIVDPHRGYSIVDATTLQQIEDCGRSGEYLLPPDTGSGIIWRIHSVARYEERDGGVYLEIEVVVLSREIPSSLRWMVSPVVARVSANALTVTLQQTREAVDRQRVAQEGHLATDHKGHN